MQTHLGEIDPVDRARALRGLAFRDCLDQRWRDCLDGLQLARELDPDGDRDPAVQAARLDALTGVEAKTDYRPEHARAYASKATRRP